MTAVRAAQALPDGDLKTVLLANERYLRAGSMGPDIFYLPPFQPYNFFSDLAHYCKTNDLALNMLRLSAPRGEQARAFAHGWFAHNVADSVAHPWVNGFTGQPYGDPAATTKEGRKNFALNLTHMGIEGWVDKQLAAEGRPSLAERARSTRESYDAFEPYQEDVIQDLMVRAYETTYANEGCGARKFAPLKKEIVAKAARNFKMTLGATGVGDFVLDLSDIELLDLELKKLALQQLEDVKKIRATWADYVGRTIQYNTKSWLSTAQLLEFNLDQGIDATQGPLNRAWGSVLSPAGDLVGVFPVPGTNYFNGRIPEYQDRCEEKKNKKEDCDAMTQSPGGDNPDDNLSSLLATNAIAEDPRDLGVAYMRLALKRGRAWPARLERLARQADALAGIADPIAFLQAFAAQGRAFDAAAEADPEFGRMVSSYEGDSSAADDTLDVAVLDQGFASGAKRTIESFGEPSLRVPPEMLSAEQALMHPVLFIPTGGLHGLSQNEQLRTGLERYLAGGGTAVVSAQQLGSDFSAVPTPDGRPIGAWGWHEDNSCYTNAAYIDTFHPILASQSTSLVSSNIDGYFDSIPENAIVLLRRVKNGLPAMFMYPYGAGWVIVSSSYDDWGGFNQTGPGARAIIRDAIAWAKKPAELPIHAPGSTVSIALRVKNVTELPAAQVKLVLMSPSRDRVVAEQAVSQALGPVETAEVPFSHALAADAELGIYHIDYELLDDAGETVQPLAEEDSGRIVVARPPPPSAYRAPDLQLSIVMPEGEEVLAGQPARFRYRLSNRAGSDRRFRLWRTLNRRGFAVVDEVAVPAGAAVEREITVETGAGSNLQQGGAFRLTLYAFEEGGTPRCCWTFDPWAFQVEDLKGFRVLPLRGEVAASADRASYAPGETASVTVTATNTIPHVWSGEVRLVDIATGSVAQAQAVSFAPNAVVPVSFAVPIVSTPGGHARYIVELGAIGHTIALKGLALRVLEPKLRAGASPVLVGGLGALSLRWELENVASVPLAAGAVTATLSSGGAALSEETKPLALGPAPDGRGSVSFALPLARAAAEVRVEATNGFGQSLRATVPIVHRLIASVRTSGADYAAGESGEVVLSLANTGNTLQEGSAAGEVEGIGILAPQSFSLPPGGVGELRFGFAVPEAAASGLHRGAIELPGLPPVAFAVSIRRPELVFGVEDRVYQGGEAIAVVLRNAAGSLATAEVESRLRDLPPVTAKASLAVGEEITVEVPIPAHLPSGRYDLRLSAEDRTHFAGAFAVKGIQVAGTAASLSVATDAEVYRVGSTITASAELLNAGLALSAAGLHLEIATPCAPAFEGVTFHFDTWDGSNWVERAARGRGPHFETDQVDLSAFWPDPDGEHKVRIRHGGLPPAALDFAALVSGGVLVAPSEAVLEAGGDVLPALIASDESGIDLAFGAVIVRFPPLPAPSLIYRAREGEPSCTPTVIWQRDVPLDLLPAAGHAISDTIVASGATLGQHVLTGTLRTRDGELLAEASKAFEVVTGELSVSARTDSGEYRTGAPVTVTGTLRNLGVADETDVLFDVRVHGRFCDASVRAETVSLAAGEARDYSLSVVPSDAFLCPFEADLAVVASISSTTGSAESERPFRVGEPALDVRFDVPDPAARLVRTSASLVAAEETDLDGVAHDAGTPLDGELPFPVVLGGVRHTGFRQSPHGFVELVAEGAVATGLGGGCLEASDAATVLAGFLWEFDPSMSGLLGYKRYPAGSLDRSGRLFEKETLVFFWDTPARYVSGRNRFQILLSEDGLIRADVGDVAAALVSPSPGCSRTGLSLSGRRPLAFGATAPYGARFEGVGRSPFEGAVTVRNDGSIPGTVSLDFGRHGGLRTTESLTVDPRETRTLTFTDTVAAPTTYTLDATGDLTASLSATVVPPEGIVVRYTGPSEVPPGLATLPLRLTKTGGVQGPVTVTLTLDGPSGSQTLTRAYDLEPGVAVEVAAAFVLAEGVSTLDVSADVPLEAEPAMLRVGPQDRVGVVLAPTVVEGGSVRIRGEIANSGLGSFAGELQVDGAGGSSTPVALASGETTAIDLAVSLAGAAPGSHSDAVRLVSAAGVVLHEATVTYEVLGPRVDLASSPAGAALTAGAPATLTFRLGNTGDQRALGTLSFRLFDEDRLAAFDIAPGGEAEIGFETLIDDDVEEKTYSGRYVIAVAGLADAAGQVNFSVDGIALDVELSLDKEAYLDGEPARLTVDVTNSRPGLGTDYRVRVHYDGFEETRPLVVSGSAAAVFEIPLPRVTGEPAFVGISHPDGRSLYINTLHVRRADALATVTLERQVYAPGAAVTITASTASPGTLTLEAQGLAESIEMTGTVTRSFALPTDLPGGTQFVSWRFTGAAGAASGSVPFDVAGLRVRVFEARLDKGRYETGESIRTTLQIHTNEPASVVLRAFVLDPEGLSQLVGETTLALDPETDLRAVHSWPFESAIGGLHRLVYGLYLPGGDTPLASGSLAFDVGHAAVLGLRTDQADYPLPGTPVLATVSAFVAAPATLRLEVDGEVVRTEPVGGLGVVELPVELAAVTPGRHELVAIIEGGGYRSEASASFSMGSSLPDLAPGLATARPVSGASWKIDVAVQNIGRSDASASLLVARDPVSGASLGAASVPPLAAGAAALVSLDWNVLGAAGAREIEVAADAGSSVVEFREDNNLSQATLEVPALVVEAVAAPSYAANVDADLYTAVTNLTADTAYAGLTVLASVLRPGGEAVALAPATVAAVGPGATAATSTPWPVGRSAPGAYVFDSRLLDSAGVAVGGSARAFEVVATHAFSGSVAASPSPALPGSALVLTGRIANEGNVAAAGSAEFEVVAHDQTIAARASTPAEVPVGAATDLSATIDPLDVQPGDYQVALELELEGRPHPVATTPLTVAGAGVEAEIAADLTPRALVYLGGQPLDPAGDARRAAFVGASLVGTGVVFRTTADPVEFARLFRSGLWNTHVVMTDAPFVGPLLGDELRETVFRGDGLGEVAWKPAGVRRELEPALGAAARGQMAGGVHELRILDGPLGPAATLTLHGSAVRFELAGATLAGTVATSPVLATNDFGRGRAVTMGFDPAVAPEDPARPPLQDLFARTVLHAAPREARPVAPGTVLPLAVRVENPGATASSVAVSLSLPPAVHLAGVEDAPASTDPPTWRLELPAGGARLLRFEVVVPDEPGSYAIGSAVEVGGHPLADPPSLVLDVTRSSEDALASVIGELDACAAPPADRGHVQAAVSHLRHAQAQDASTLAGLEARIHFAVAASEKLGKVEGIDVDPFRSEIALLIAAWERRSFDLIVTN
jgi:hypothetical protein